MHGPKSRQSLLRRQFRTARVLSVDQVIKGAQLSGGEDSHSLRIMVSRRQRIFTPCRPFRYLDFPFDY